jgi:hypothetical protein
MNTNRGLVDMPSWQKTGPLGWANFSRHADLAMPAMALYPLWAFSGLFLSVGTLLSFRWDRTAPRSAATPLYLATLMAAAGLLTTIKAAPNMLRVRHLGDDEAALQRSLDGFQFWGNIRGLFQVLAFVANLWALVALVSPASGSESEDTAHFKA